jgi:adenylate kinase
MHKVNQVVILLGPPGSGKGTQADLLSDKLGYLHFGMGQMIRDYMRNHPEDLEVRRLYDNGILQPDDFILGLFSQRISELMGKYEGIVLDAFPMSVKQAEVLTELLNEYKITPKVFYVHITPETVQSRLALRKICNGCKTPFAKGQESYDAKTCVLCGGHMEVRTDDKPEVIANRIAEYEERTGPIKDYYKKQGVLKIINGERAVAEVQEDLISNIT